ncbi:MAG: hypothetical protein LPL29_14540 [Alphaproteobacteria bacterium]|nr:hypothetical protein [Alphaproteobacteria bacterium]
MSSDYACRFSRIVERGSFAGLRVIVRDPEIDPETRTNHKNVYEDLDQETPSSPRLALITMYPQYSRDMAFGRESTAQVIVTHEKAVRDMQIMVERFGWEIALIEREREREREK